MKINVNFPKYLPRCCIFSFCTFSAGKNYCQLVNWQNLLAAASVAVVTPGNQEMQSCKMSKKRANLVHSISHWYLVLGGWISIGKWPIDHCDQLINDHCDHCGNRCTGHWTLWALLQSLNSNTCQAFMTSPLYWSWPVHCLCLHNFFQKGPFPHLAQINGWQILNLVPGTEIKRLTPISLARCKYLTNIQND